MQKKDFKKMCPMCRNLGNVSMFKLEQDWLNLRALYILMNHLLFTLSTTFSGTTAQDIGVLSHTRSIMSAQCYEILTQAI